MQGARGQSCNKRHVSNKCMASNKCRGFKASVLINAIKGAYIRSFTVGAYIMRYIHIYTEKHQCL